MTILRPPLQPETSNQQQAKNQTIPSLPWYRSGIVWLGIGLTMLVIVGCVHLILVTRAYVHTIDNPSVDPSSKELTHFRGMPLHSLPQSEPTEQGKDTGKAEQ